MRVLHKKTLRTILKNRGQAIAVVMVVLMGTACYVCLGSLHRDLRLTRDTYYAQNRFADFEIMLERAPTTALFKLEEIAGVRGIRGRIVEEVKVDVAGVEESRTGRIVSMPDRHLDVINNIVIDSGRYFERGALDEVIVSKQFAAQNHMALGDRVEMTVDGKRHSLRMVGTALSPEYVYVIRSVQELIPNPERFGIFWVPNDFAESALSMQSACNNIVGTVDDPAQLDRILDEAEDTLESYGIFAKVKAEDQVSNNFISEEIRGLTINAKIMPTIFLGISSLVIMVLLNRMVRNERTQIGLLKAYGHSSVAVAFHYLQYALALSVAGTIGGFLLGEFLAVQMMGIYVQFYQFPLLATRVYPEVLATAASIAISFSLIGAIAAAYRAARISPAASMRPPAPARGNRTPLERFVGLWAQLTFTWKMIARNVFRNWFRSSLNVFGVMISCALLIVGSYATDAMDYILRYQYELTQKEEATVAFYVERGRDALYEVQRADHVETAEPLLRYPFEMSNGWRKKDVVVLGLARDGTLRKLLDDDENEIDIGTRGLVLTDGIAEQLGVAAGDSIRVKPLMGRITAEKDVPVSKVVRQFFGSSAYMNIDALSRVLDEPFAMNAALIRAEPGMLRTLDDSFKDVPAVATVEYKEDSYNSIKETMAQSMWIMNMVTVIFAGVIAFSIIYNVTTVSLAERERELASLRVLGFSIKEVGRILFNENFLMATIGVLLGIPCGMGMTALMVRAFQTDLFRFPFHLEASTFVTATVLTAVFVAIANFAVRRRLYQLDLVEVLKARE